MNAPGIALPSEAPVMVLPGAVLFPQTIIPLRIFEPRYRAMLQWALDRDRMFCIALMRPGLVEAVTEDQFFHTAGIGLISASVTQADGTSNLMLQGIARVRFTGFSQLAPFRIAKFETIRPVTADAGEIAALAKSLRRQCAAIRVSGASLPASFLELLEKITAGDILANTIAQALVADPMGRQRLLEETDTPARLRELARIVRGEFPEG